jgi:hypothetical protein
MVLLEVDLMDDFVKRYISSNSPAYRFLPVLVIFEFSSDIQHFKPKCIREALPPYHLSSKLLVDLLDKR